jgi:O-antigen/teichoic acid export membrane protein
MKRMSSGAAIAFSLGSRIGSLCLSLATGIIMARTLGPAGRGATSAIALWPLVLSGVLTLGIPVALRYHVRRRDDDAEQLLSVAVTMSVSLSVVAVTVGVLFIPSWLGHYPASVVAFARLMMLFAPFMMVNALLQAFCEARGDFAHSGRMLYLPPLGTLSGLVALYLLHHLNVFTVAVAYELPYSCITVATLYRLRHAFRLPSDVVRRGRMLLHFGLRAWGLDILNTLSSQIGQVIVVSLLSASSFGLYAVALNVSRTLYILGQSVNAVLFPKAAELDSTDAIALVSRSARVMLAVNTVAGAVLITAMPFLIRLAYGTPYLPDVRLAQILTCEVVIGATASTLTQAFMATGRPGLVTIFQTLALCVTFPLMLIFIPVFGLVGAAYALLSSTILRALLILASYPIFLKHGAPRLLLTREDLREISLRARRLAGAAP